MRQRDLLQHLQEKVLTVGELRHRFENAWQPEEGSLRIFQPLSFDLLEASKIVEKAVYWNALLSQLRKADKDFYVYLLLGRPSDPKRIRAFDQASKTLGEDDPARKELVPEEDASEFADALEKEIRATSRN